MPKCQICNSYRPLEEHLFELSELCRYLNNHAEFTYQKKSTYVYTEVIANWLKLACHLQKVDMSWWRFRDDMSEIYCPSDIDEVNSDKQHYTNYSTVLTRFMYISNAVEETYRFVHNRYDDIESIKEIPKEKRFRDASMRATVTLDKVFSQKLPVHYMHAMTSLNSAYQAYADAYAQQLKGTHNAKVSDASFGLHIIRNIRNSIAHGSFPIIDNPIYVGNERMKQLLLTLLIRASRFSALYIQSVILNCCENFNSHDYYLMNEVWGETEDYFEKNCTVEYAKHLHIKGEFSFSQPLEYRRSL